MKGYVKLCATWAERMWFKFKDSEYTHENITTGVNSNYSSTLGTYSTKFDACGALDGDDVVPYPSQYSKWKDCLAFLEWFGIPLMPGFIPILVDDKNPKEYEYLF